MHRHAVLSSLHLGRTLAAPRPSTDAQRTAWIGVYPLDLSSPTTRQFLRNKGIRAIPTTGRAYHIRAFEIDRKLSEADVWVHEPDLCNSKSTFAFSDDELLKQLESLGVPIETLELPYKSDYPI